MVISLLFHKNVLWGQHSKDSKWGDTANEIEQSCLEGKVTFQIEGKATNFIKNMVGDKTPKDFGLARHLLSKLI